jgi:hypothetical protein
MKARHVHTLKQPTAHEAPPTVPRNAAPSASPTTPLDVQTSGLLPSSLTLSSTVTVLSPGISGTISGVTGSHLPGVVEEFMKDIGKGGDGERETVRDIYLFTGRAHWESRLTERLMLSSGSAKALVGLLSNIA